MQAGIQPTVFATTRWSLVVAGMQFQEGGQQACDALAELCRTYWRPIFSFVSGVAILTKTRRILPRISLS